MRFSKTAQQEGSSGFFFDNDKNTPIDAIKVSDIDVQTAINLQNGATYSFDVLGVLTVTLAPIPTAAQILSNTQSDKLSVLSASCALQIYAGFQSSALGSVHTYPAKDKDQANLVASYAASFDPTNAAGWTTRFWCEDSTGAWALVTHTAAQIQQVGRDGKAAITTAIQKNTTLSAQVMAATTVAAVQAVVW